MRREYAAQMEYRAHLQAFIDRWRYNANRAAQAQMKIKVLEKLPELEAPEAEETEKFRQVSLNNLLAVNPQRPATNFGDFLTWRTFVLTPGDLIVNRFPDAEKISPPLLQLNEVTFGYTPDKIILKNANIDVGLDSRIAVVGPNGAGKSTL